MPLDIENTRRLCPEHDLHYFASIDSTMNEAAKLVARKAPHGTLVVADEQTAGMGRLGRSWQSSRDLGIYCSVLLRLPLPAESLPLITLVLGLATAEAIEKSTTAVCDLRWPNDILINERKVAGILAHLVEDYVIAGIGINVNQTSFPAGLRTPPTSLRIESGGATQSRESILLNLIHSLDAFCAMLITEGPEWILRAFISASSYAIDRRVLIEEDGRKGVTAGIDENGFLLVRLDSGSIEKIAAGGVRPAS
ncbi:MAG: biotin--[acetyl-CoA-carboxylase] ligase [Acidobacteriaceae bacterium]|nr:biotin--[acetyl-CoA-carboxylase] ligase [Acidobacteriaceae bacterium]MBV9779277.1 biotin--[acetyl-CoA-carboxylase] ligase [Acidobacteriaceae bacterium]